MASRRPSGKSRPPRAAAAPRPPAPSTPDGPPADPVDAGGTLERSVTEAAGANLAAPPAQLALTYARLIDDATHVPPAMADALRTIAAACQLTEGDEAAKAFRKVSAALSAATIASDLGPKLLAALDALLLTPKARAVLDRKLNAAAGKPTNPLEQLRAEEDDLTRKRRERAGA